MFVFWKCYYSTGGILKIPIIALTISLPGEKKVESLCFTVKEIFKKDEVSSSVDNIFMIFGAIIIIIIFLLKIQNCFSFCCTFSCYSPLCI